MLFKKPNNVQLSDEDLIDLTGNAVVLPSYSRDHIVLKNSKGSYMISANGIITKAGDRVIESVDDLSDEELIMKFVDILNKSIQRGWKPFYIKDVEELKIEHTKNKEFPFTLFYKREDKMGSVLTSAPILFGLASGLLDFMLFENMINTKDFASNHGLVVNIDAYSYHLDGDSEDSLTWDYYLLSQEEPSQMIKEFLRYVQPEYL